MPPSSPITHGNPRCINGTSSIFFWTEFTQVETWEPLALPEGDPLCLGLSISLAQIGASYSTQLTWRHLILEMHEDIGIIFQRLVCPSEQSLDWAHWRGGAINEG